MEKIYMAGPWISEHEIMTVERAMRDWYNKPYWYCEAFENVFAEYHNRKFALMTPNCTSAIWLLLRCLGIGPGDEVLLPECTWIATGAGVTHIGATPIFCDIEKDDWCLSPESVRKNLTRRTKAMIAVDLFGNMPKMNELEAIAEDAGIYLIEDAAEALGSSFNGIRAGKFGVGSAFSFHRTKTLTTGEGGMLLLDDDRLFEKCSMWRDHGRKPGGAMYYNAEVTYKFMPFNVQAAIGYAQFQRLDQLVDKKRWILNAYKERLADVGDVQLNAEPSHVVNGAWITGLVPGKSYRLNKEEFMDALAGLEVPSRPFFYPLSSLPAYPGLRENYENRNPVAYDIADRGINLPGALNLTQEQIDFVCEGIIRVLGI